jgi:predicted DNA-binding transcriptional regulator YafY
MSAAVNKKENILSLISYIESNLTSELNLRLLPKLGYVSSRQLYRDL